MNLKHYLLLAAASLSLITSFTLDARGGGRGGGGGRSGGGARGGAYSRTPSMSRADPGRRSSSQIQRAPQQVRSQPAQQRQRPVPQQRPSPQQRTQQRAPVNRSDLQNQMRQQVQQRAPTRSPQGQLNQQQFRDSYQNLRSTQRQAADNVRDGVRANRSNYRDYFGDNFNNRFDYRPNWYTPGFNAWRASNWNDLNGWLGWGWNDPYYYDDQGTYYEVAVPVETTRVIPTTTVTPVQAIPVQQSQENWMSLGVFAVTQNEQNASYTNMFVQLVVEKTGVLSGTYYNAGADQIHPLDGFIDQSTQQAVWRVADNPNSPIMTTGIYNLTQNVADVKIRFSNGSEQYWKFIRLE